MTTSTRQLIIILVVVILCIAGGVFYFFYGGYRYLGEDMNEYNTHYEEAHDAHHAGDFGRSISMMENLLLETTSVEAKVHIQSVLAFDLYQRNQGNDRTRAMEMYKAIVTDASLPVRLRALVLSDLALLLDSQTLEFLRVHFTEEPFSAFLPQEGATLPVTKTVLEMLKYADTLFPTSIAEYGIVYHLSILLRNGALPAGTSKEVIAQLMQDYIRSADGRIGEVSYEQSHIARQRLYRALGLTGSNRILNNISFADRENAFKSVLELQGAPEEASYQVRAVLMQARFFYAAFLLEFAEGDRDADIQNILRIFAEAVNEPTRFATTRSYFTRLFASKSANYIQQTSGELAEISPEFKKFVEDVGLEEN